MTDISVVIPTCDRPRLLFAALQSVLAQTKPPAEIVVVDNGITSVLPDQLPCNVILERLPARVGVSRARNAGAKKARSAYVAFLDDDDIWDPDYLKHVVGSIADARTPPDLLLGRIDVNRDGKQQVWKCVTNAQTLMPKLLYGNPGVGGTNLIVARKTFFEIGGFDETFMGSEDRVLALDFLQAGSQIIPVPGAVAIAREAHDGPQLRGSAVLLVSKKRFIAKYRRLMDVDDWLAAHAQILALRSRNNSIYLPLELGLQFLRRLVVRLPESFKKVLTKSVRAGAPNIAALRGPTAAYGRDTNPH